MMKRLKFLETKRTPRYSLRKLNVGVASVLLGVTIFGINFTNHSVKAETIESVKSSNSSPETQGSADTDINSSAATVDGNNINTQLAKENQELANKNNLTSSDNHSSNI